MFHLWRGFLKAPKRKRPHYTMECFEQRCLLSALIWSDEFNGAVGSAPNAANWNYDLGGGGWGNSELETYTSSTQNSSIVADSAATDGKALAITAIQQSDGTYTSARLQTSSKVTLAYGRIEVRAKLPYGQGMWPAIWMLGSNISSAGWPGAGEIDVMENIGKEPSIVHGSMHGPGYSGGNPLTGQYTLPSGQFSDAYHVFAIDWTPTSVRFYVDNILYETRTPASVPKGDSWVFDHSFYFLLNLAVGGTWPGNPDGTTVFPQTFLVDYFRVYSELPGGWSDADIGGPSRIGGAALDSSTGVWGVTGSGADIFGTSDQFNFASQSLTGDGTVSALITSASSTNSSAKAGVMFRDSDNSNAPSIEVIVTPSNDVRLQWRSSAGGSVSSTVIPSVSLPLWVRLNRAGNVFTGSYSSDGSSWNAVGSPQTIAMQTTSLAGLAACAHDNTALNTVTFADVSVLPAGWSDADIGAPSLPGSASYDGPSNSWSVNGSGADIFGTSDQLNFASETLPGDGSIVALLTSETDTNSAAKSGVMFRDSLASNAPFADLLVTPSSDVRFQYRSASGGSVTSMPLSGVSTPLWIKLVRAGNSFSGFYSVDGTTWIQVGSTQTIVMQNQALAGLAVCSHDNTKLGESIFTNVSLVATAPLPSSVIGSGSNDHFVLRVDPTNPQNEQLFVNIPTNGNPTYLASRSSLNSLSIGSAGGAANLTLDFTYGNPLLPGGISFDGGANGVADGDTLSIQGTTGPDKFAFDATHVIDQTGSGGTLTFADIQNLQFNLLGGGDVLTQNAQPAAGLSVTFNGSTSADTLNIEAGTFTYPVPAGTGITVDSLGTLFINSGAKVVLPIPADQDERAVLVLGSLSLAGSAGQWSGVLDLGSNDLDLKNAGAAGLAMITNALVEGMNRPSGFWNGAGGIISSAVAGDTRYLTSLGAIQSRGNAFDGINTSANDVLVKYTYLGDADLSGTVNGADYQQIDSGFGSHLTGWFYGDFNYDNIVDGSDYSLIDNAFNQLLATSATPLEIQSTHKASSMMHSESGIGSFSQLKARPQIILAAPQTSPSAADLIDKGKVRESVEELIDN